MIPARTPEFLVGMVRELCLLPSETEWVEFKGNSDNPETIGRNISALANGAAINGKTSASAIWGIDDETHEISGTTFSPATARKGNEPLETWLYSQISPHVDFRFNDIEINGRWVVTLGGRACITPTCGLPRGGVYSCRGQHEKTQGLPRKTAYALACLRSDHFRESRRCRTSKRRRHFRPTRLPHLLRTA